MNGKNRKTYKLIFKCSKESKYSRQKTPFIADDIELHPSSIVDDIELYQFT